MVASNILHKSGNIFDTQQPALAHGVNPQGLMTAGIAAKILSRHPRILFSYICACASGELKYGHSQIIKLPESRKYAYRNIINMSTQNAGGTAKVEYIEAALNRASAQAHREGITGIALPKIGTGVGHLDWDSTYKAIKRVAARYPEMIYEIWSYEK